MNARPLLLFIITVVGCLSQFGADIYAPAIPAIARHLGTHVNFVQTSMSIYMLGVALSLLFYGPLSEAYGRKKPFILGLSIMMVGSLICFFATSISALIVGRFIQGTGAGASAGLWRSIFRDAYQGEDLAKYASYLTLAVAFVIPAAPLVGGYIQHYLNWHMIFVVMLIYTLLAMLLLLFVYNESSQHHHRDRLQFTFIKTTYLRIFSHRQFLLISLSSFCTFGAMFSWVTISPVLFIQLLGLTPVQFGWIIFISSALGFTISGLLNGFFVHRFGIHNMMRLGWCLNIMSSCVMLLFYFLMGMTFWGVYIPSIVFFCGCAFIWPNAFALIMDPFGDVAGYAGPSYTLLQTGGGGVITTLAAHLPDRSPIPIALLIIACSGMSILLLHQADRKPLATKI